MPPEVFSHLIETIRALDPVGARWIEAGRPMGGDLYQTSCRLEEDEARAGQVTRFRAVYPDAVPVRKSGAWDADDGIGVYRATRRGPAAEVLWDTGQLATERISVIPEWPEPVQLRAERGRTAHTWRGGGKGVCGAPLNRAALPTPATKPCPKCAAIEAARGGAS